MADFGEPSCSKVGYAIVDTQQSDDVSDLYGKDEGVQPADDEEHAYNVPILNPRFELDEDDESDDNPCGLYIFACLSFFCCCCSFVGCCAYADRMGPRQRKAWRTMVICTVLGIVGWFILFTFDPLDQFDTNQETCIANCPEWCDPGSIKYDTRFDECLCKLKGSTTDCF